MQNRIHVLVLQHPREPRERLGTAPLLSEVLDGCTVSTGLSWPNLKAALQKGIRKQASPPPEAVPANWAVLYLGTKKELPVTNRQPGLYFLNRKGNTADHQDEIRSRIRGLVILDGTWAQAKSMWWKNPWLLKLQRAILIPTRASLYGEKRREPRKECVSSLEAAASALSALGEKAEVEAALMKQFKIFLSSPPAPASGEETKDSSGE